MVGAGAGAGAVEEERELAEKYGLDGERLESLVRSVNVPGVLESSGAGAGGGTRYVGDAEGGEDIPVTEVSFVVPVEGGGGWGVGLCADVVLPAAFLCAGRVERANVPRAQGRPCLMHSPCSWF